jgi:hypothetical protein
VAVEGDRALDILNMNEGDQPVDPLLRRGGTESGGRGRSVSCSFTLSIVAQMPSSETEIVPVSSIPCARQNACASTKTPERPPTPTTIPQPLIG